MRSTRLSAIRAARLAGSAPPAAIRSSTKPPIAHADLLDPDVPPAITAVVGIAGARVSLFVFLPPFQASAPPSAALDNLVEHRPGRVDASLRDHPSAGCF